MKKRGQTMRSGGTWMVAGEVVGKVGQLLQTIILTRTLSEEQFGLAGVFMIVVTFFELLTDLGTHNLVYQAADADDPRLVDCIHGVSVARGAGLGLVIFLAAPLLARLFYPEGAAGVLLGGVDRYADGLRWIALVPVFRSFYHIGSLVALRHQEYRPGVYIAILPTLATLAAAYPVARYFHAADPATEYRAMVALILAQEGLRALCSHVFTGVSLRWRCSLARDYMARIASFGWPLMANGLLFFVINLGDRTLLAGAGPIFGPLFGHDGYPPAEWAFYGVAMQLSSVPGAVYARIVSRMGIPMFARTRDDPDRLAFRYRSLLELSAVGGALMAVGMTLAGGMVALVFKDSYGAEAGRYLGPASLAQAILLVNNVPTITLLALGDTKGTLWMNIHRSLAFVGMLACAAGRADLWWMAMMGVAGAVLAVRFGYARLRRADGRFGGWQWISVAFAACFAAAAMAVDARLPADAYARRVGAALALGLAVPAAGHFVFRGLKDQIRRMIRGDLASDRER